MSNGIIGAKKSGYARPSLKQYGSFSKLTASGSGVDSEVFPDNMGQNMMRRP